MYIYDICILYKYTILYIYYIFIYNIFRIYIYIYPSVIYIYIHMYILYIYICIFYIWIWNTIPMILCVAESRLYSARSPCCTNNHQGLIGFTMIFTWPSAQGANDCEFLVPKLDRTYNLWTLNSPHSIYFRMTMHI